MPHLTKKLVKGMKKMFSTSKTSKSPGSISPSSSSSSLCSGDLCQNQELPAHEHNGCVGGQIVFDVEDNAKPPCAVIVTIKSGSSYDDLYTSTPQVSPDDTVAVKVFHFNYATIPDILRCIRGKACQLAGETLANVIHQMLDCRKQVDADSFVVNFECCSGCTCTGFEDHAAGPVLDLLGWMIQEQHVAMFADYSLKSLISDWSTKVLGPNPFINLGDTANPLSVRFEPEKLLESPNTQLQNLGRMCNTGEAYINVLPSTIVFTTKPEASMTSAYELEVLTTVENNTPYEGILEKDRRKSRTVGHAILRYPSGACILVSAGHWMELNHLGGVDEHTLLRTTEMTMGLEEANTWRSELDSTTCSQSRTIVLQKCAKKTLLSSPPCKYSSASSK